MERIFFFFFFSKNTLFFRYFDYPFGESREILSTNENEKRCEMWNGLILNGDQFWKHPLIDYWRHRMTLVGAKVKD